VAGVGALHIPNIPELPGIENFSGKTFHSAQWDHSYDLTGKRVAVVGTGASAIQFVPKIARQVASMKIFQRTPPWIMPKADRCSAPCPSPNGSTATSSTGCASRQRWGSRSTLASCGSRRGLRCGT
jgi:cation diffusion facilitator CzcD-associated flavoprotein CzcO